ncbi:hypothetical protein B0H10DRAFT_2066252 [Mycena sp. CBHHK59/15]|nr:hypothetical protein B0H10DRAFT_2066252 [Mycena sp. CBHHK59/15]
MSTRAATAFKTPLIGRGSISTVQDTFDRTQRSHISKTTTLTSVTNDLHLGEAPNYFRLHLHPAYSRLTPSPMPLLPSLLPPSPASPMSSIFPRRGRRDDSDDSYVDLSPPPPISEKRRHSPFSYLRNRKRSTEGKSKTAPQNENTDTSGPPLVPPLSAALDRNFSDPDLAYGHLGTRAYSQVRSPGSNSSNESTLFGRTPPTRPGKFAPRFETPSLENLPSVNGSASFLAAAAMMSAQQPSGLPHSGSGQFPGHSMVPHSGHRIGNNLVRTVEMDKAKVAAKVGPLITTGMLNLIKAQTLVDEIVASEAWSVVKEQATAVLAPAKDVLLILDSVIKYIPALMVILKHEIEKHENDKNILVVYHTMSIFWFTLCDLQIIFRAAEQIKTSLDTFFEAVGKTMQDFGNFRESVFKMLTDFSRIARSVRSGEYRKKLTTFAQAFADHKSSLQFILTQSSAIKVNEMSGNINTMNAKLDQVLQFISRQTPLELSVAQQMQENGGPEAALQNPQFLIDLARNTFHEELSPQAHASIRQDLDDALNANLPAFALKVEAAQKEMEDSVERSTETILHQLNSGPYQLIKDEDIKAVWQSTFQNWRISCKARHFVDAVHNHFAQKFGEHRHESGMAHPEQWTLNVLSQVIYYPNISDAIDDDGSGYISVHEVNQFFKSRPKEWSAVQWLSFWAAGWKQNSITYKSRCVTLFAKIEASAKRVLPQNRRCVKTYLKTSGLSELWLVVDSLNTDGTEHRGRHQATKSEPLNALRVEIMQKETIHIQSRLERILYQLESPETVSAVLGTHRLEGFILCFVQLILGRHLLILNAANTLVLSDREFESMTFSLRNLVAAISYRYHTLTESWKQQRLDTNFLVQCFAGGIFNDWHEVFHDIVNVETPKASSTDMEKADESSHRPEDILIFPIPTQPSESAETTDRRGDLEDGSPPRPLRHMRRNLQDNSSSSGYFYNFDFEHHGPHDEVLEADSSISQVYRKTKKPKLEDRITSLETELSDIKGMLNQLILISTARGSL